MNQSHETSQLMIMLSRASFPELVKLHNDLVLEKAEQRIIDKVKREIRRRDEGWQS